MKTYSGEFYMKDANHSAYIYNNVSNKPVKKERL